MCGIAGWVSTVQETSDEMRLAVQAMIDAQQHRGPDDAGLEAISAPPLTVVLGHRRLAIIDLSPAGHQPMCDPDTGNWITFNGEIYNFRELRQLLEKRGCTFRSQSDTEVILKAYAVWGAECVTRLRGIFAFGLWDAQAGRLVLARDQIGVKPLYYSYSTGQLMFASEVRALLASGQVERRLDVRGLRSFLAYGSVQEPLTMVDGVQSLLPGHVLVWQAGRIRIERFWQLPQPGSTKPAFNDVLTEVSALLAEAVRLQMIADVPLGAFLSGGIDSSVIVAMMKQSGLATVKSFSVVFDERAYDERQYAQFIAQRVGADHTELLLTGDMVRRDLPKAMAAYDQPSIDGLNTYYVAQVTKQAGLTVALSGLGGDEVFGGYNGFHKILTLERLCRAVQWLPHPVRNMGGRWLDAWDRDESARKMASLLNIQQPSYFAARELFSPAQCARLLPPDLAQATHDWWPDNLRQLMTDTAGYDSINRASAFEMQTYMLSTLLRDTDQMSMAHALEVRVPLLDHKLVEFVFALPGSYKLAAQQVKPLLSHSLQGIMPSASQNRPKQGFELPFAVWFKQHLWEDMQTFFLRESHPELPFNRAELSLLWQQFESNRLSWSRVWGMFILKNWLCQHKVTL